jgi:EAL domain-containing protein (putative c-di-GMP-specific phosphodiesterase class I)/DNA-binding NarL/FixJ family response regulator
MTRQSRTARRRVLVIDDNPAIHEDVRKILAPQPAEIGELAASEALLFGDRGEADAVTAPDLEYQIDSAFQGEDGVALAERARREHRPYAITFVDARMPPGLDGIETIARLWEKDPDIQVVLCTAYSDHSWQQIRRRLPHPERLIVLKKPFDNIEVQQLAESLTEKWWLARTERERLQRLEALIGERSHDAHFAHEIDPQLATCDRRGSQPDAAEQRRSAIEGAMAQAVQADQFYLHYQPLVDIATRSVVGLEALLRWKHPELGVVSPAEFIPIAEATGLIVPIGEFVLRSACAQVRRWQRAQVPVVPVAVNVSAVQLNSPGIWSRIRQILKEEDAQPQNLVLEITESSLMENASRHAAALQALRADGIDIEIDDFGTGYSSLSCLQHLPLDTIKIDRSFVTHLGTSRTEEAIVCAILAMAHSLGLRAVAEGVETPEQLEVLRRHGCEIAQGYYFCAPIPAVDCEKLLIDLAVRTSFTDTLRLKTQSSLVAHASGNSRGSAVKYNRERQVARAHLQAVERS